MSDNVWVDLTHSKLDPSNVTDFVRDNRAGAIVYFGGTTRDNFGGKQVSELSYEAYEQLAKKTLSKIAQAALKMWPITPASPESASTSQIPTAYLCKVAIVHRLGVVPIGEESVCIAVSSGHRKEGWEAAEWILERVKESAEIWKNERYTDGTGAWMVNDGSRPGGCGCSH